MRYLTFGTVRWSASRADRNSLFLFFYPPILHEVSQVTHDSMLHYIERLHRALDDAHSGIRRCRTPRLPISRMEELENLVPNVVILELRRPGLLPGAAHRRAH